MGRTGEVMDDHSFNRHYLAKDVRASGLKKLHPHGFKHTAATVNGSPGQHSPEPSLSGRSVRHLSTGASPVSARNGIVITVHALAHVENAENSSNAAPPTNVGGVRLIFVR